MKSNTIMVTLEQAQTNFNLAKSRLSSKQKEISKLKKKSIFKGVTIKDQFNVGRSGIKFFRRQRKTERNLTLKQLGLSSSELPMLRDELNLRKSELDVIGVPSFGDII